MVSSRPDVVSSCLAVVSFRAGKLTIAGQHQLLAAARSCADGRFITTRGVVPQGARRGPLACGRCGPRLTRSAPSDTARGRHGQTLQTAPSPTGRPCEGARFPWTIPADAATERHRTPAPDGLCPGETRVCPGEMQCPHTAARMPWQKPAPNCDADPRGQARHHRAARSAGSVHRRAARARSCWDCPSRAERHAAGRLPRGVGVRAARRATPDARAGAASGLRRYRARELRRRRTGALASAVLASHQGWVGAAPTQARAPRSGPARLVRGAVSKGLVSSIRCGAGPRFGRSWPSVPGMGAGRAPGVGRGGGRSVPSSRSARWRTR